MKETGNKTIGRLGDIPDMRRYLEEDCYCPGEIYSPDGFFFQVFDVGCECVEICRNDDTLVITSKCDEDASPQLIFIWFDGDRIEDTQRIDATENNLRFAKAYVGGKADGMRIDEYKKGATAKALSDVFALSDGIIID